MAHLVFSGGSRGQNSFKGGEYEILIKGLLGAILGVFTRANGKDAVTHGHKLEVWTLILRWYIQSIYIYMDSKSPRARGFDLGLSLLVIQSVGSTCSWKQGCLFEEPSTSNQNAVCFWSIVFCRD